MIILIAGTSHTGKTNLSQKLLENGADPKRQHRFNT